MFRDLAPKIVRRARERTIWVRSAVRLLLELAVVRAWGWVDRWMALPEPRAWRTWPLALSVGATGLAPPGPLPVRETPSGWAVRHQQLCAL